MSQTASSHTDPPPYDAHWLNQQIIENASASMILVDALDPAQPILYVNAAFERDTGYPRAEVIGRNARFLQAGDHAQPALGVLRRALRHRENCTVILRNYRKDGSLFWNELHISPLRDPAGIVTHFLGIQHDVTEREQLVQAYRALVDESEAGVEIIQEGRFVLVNRAVAAIYGYTVEELLSLPADQVLPAWEQERTAQYSAARLRGEPAPSRYDLNILRKDGTHGWVEVHATVISYRGQPAIQASIVDISERKKQDAERRELTEQLELVISTARIGVWSLDVNTGVLDWNDTLHDIYGVSREGFARQVISWEQFVHPDDYASANASLERAFSTGHVEDVQFRIIRPDGQIRYIYASARALVDENQAMSKVLGVNVDVTDLRTANDLLGGIIDHIPMMIAVLDPQGRFQFVNQHWVDRLGWKAAELNAQADPLRVLFPDPDQSREVYAYFAAARPDWMDFRTATRTNEVLETSWANVRLPDGHTIRIGKDITERNRAQRSEFQIALEQERMRLLASFIQDAAHEFRTPLATISTSAYLAGRTTDAQQREAKVAQIGAQVSLLTRLVDSMLKMTRLENLGSLRSSAIDLPSFLEGLCEQMRTINGPQPAILCDVPPDLPAIWGDREHLKTALEQILDNAFRFTPPDGHITLSAGLGQNRVWLEITDTGPGIAPEVLPYIFETFWRQDTAHSTPGLGLGLAIARRIIELHEGRITAHSRVGEGTSFRIVFVRFASGEPGGGSLYG